MVIVGLISFFGQANVWQSQAGLWDDSVSVGGAWKWSPWYGFFADTGTGWIYHYEHGWIYCEGTSSASVWFYDHEWGWLWSSADCYPYLWRYRDGSWLYYARDSQPPRSFWNVAVSAWERDGLYSASDLRGRWSVTVTGAVNGVSVNTTVPLENVACASFMGAPYVATPPVVSGCFSNGPFSVDIHYSSGAVSLAGNVQGEIQCAADGGVTATVNGSLSGSVAGMAVQENWTTAATGHFASRTRFECRTTTTFNGAVAGFPVSGAGELTIVATQP